MRDGDRAVVVVVAFGAELLPRDGEVAFVVVDLGERGSDGGEKDREWSRYYLFGGSDDNAPPLNRSCYSSLGMDNGGSDSKVCAVTGCNRPVRCRGVCKTHYRKLLKYGDPTVSRMPTYGLSVAERLAYYIDKSGGPEACWPWTGRNRHQFGYGVIWDKRLGRAEEAHRVAWRLANGPIPDGHFVLHNCDNPPCCNPAHLYTGTQKQNIADIYSRGRQSKWNRRGEANSFAKLTDDAVREIRRLSAAGLKPTEIGRRYGVERTSIKNVLAGRTWKHVV